jgi:DNA invertase Pin-like site-specific DNA recombinase
VIDTCATIRVLDRSYIDLGTPIGRGFMAMFSAMAEDERGRIIKRPTMAARSPRRRA